MRAYAFGMQNFFNQKKIQVWIWIWMAPALNWSRSFYVPKIRVANKCYPSPTGAKQGRNGRRVRLWAGGKLLLEGGKWSSCLFAQIEDGIVCVEHVSQGIGGEIICAKIVTHYHITIFVKTKW